MKYLIEQFRWENKEYYHLINSKVFESNCEDLERKYSKDGSYFTITKLENEIQTTRRKARG